MKTSRPLLVSFVLTLTAGLPAARAESLPPDTLDLATRNTAFALNLYGELKSSGDNLFFSPYSISTALAMTYGGARGETASQMAGALQLAGLPASRVHAAFGGLRTVMDSISDRGNVRLSVANAIWPQKGFPFLKDYLGLLKQDYGSTITPLDYAADPAASAQVINEWVDGQTQHKITGLIGPKSLNPNTRLLLVNAIYFMGHWSSPFKAEDTFLGTFHLSASRDVKHQMMHQTANFAYAETPDLKIVELPYDGAEISMVVLLPRSVDGIRDLENSLNTGRLAGWIGSLQETRISLQLPKFTQTTTFSLTSTLKEMGMPLAFDPKADFSGMDGPLGGLFISDVVHKAYVRVDEAGTEAAAATAVEMEFAMMRQDPIPEFTADHPFLFLLRQRSTGTILFMGRVMEPKD